MALDGQGGIGNLQSFAVQVEALESGVFRSDLPTRFKLQPAAYQVPKTTSASAPRCTMCWLHSRCTTQTFLTHLLPSPPGIP